MLQFIKEWLWLIDAIAKVATTAGVIGLLLAFFHYRHAVRIAKRNERRAAVELAAKESTNFGSILMPGFLKLRKDIEVSGCQFFQRFRLIREEETLKSDHSSVTEADYARLEEHLSETLRLLNLMEGFSIPFTAGVADDRIGFLECGRAFIGTFEQNFGLYARHNLKFFYPSTQALYWKWRKQIEKDDRRRMHLEAGKEFFALTEEIVRSETNSKPLRFAFSRLRKLLDKSVDGK